MEVKTYKDIIQRSVEARIWSGFRPGASPWQATNDVDNLLARNQEITNVMAATEAGWRVRLSWEDPQLTSKNCGVTRMGELIVLWA
jgi:hypothetical protein